jgi:ferredoxin
MTHVIFDLCIRDGACAEVCPVEAIYGDVPMAQWPLWYIDPDTCIDCGKCVAECPADAIRPAARLPVEFPQYAGATAVNAAYFSIGPGINR